MGFVDNRPSRMQGRFLGGIGRGEQQLSVMINIIVFLVGLLGGCQIAGLNHDTPFPHDRVVARPAGGPSQMA